MQQFQIAGKVIKIELSLVIRFSVVLVTSVVCLDER